MLFFALCWGLPSGICPVPYCVIGTLEYGMHVLTEHLILPSHQALRVIEKCLWQGQMFCCGGILSGASSAQETWPCRILPELWRCEL